jgi:Spy/CpxP family protein refolding chaperone
MKKWIAISLILGLGVSAVGFIAYAQARARTERGGHEFMARGSFGRGGFQGRAHVGRRLLAMLDNPRVKQSLGLTDEQTGQLRKIVVQAEEATIKTGAGMAVRGIELRESLRADHPDRQAVMKEADEISALHAQMMKQHLDSLLAAKSVLTSEQQAKIRSFGERHAASRGFSRERFFNRRVPGRGMGPGGPSTAPHPPAAQNP